MTEVVAFFQVPQMSTEDMVAMVQQGLVLLTQYSKAGLQYAIETHKVWMWSQYKVKPMPQSLYV